MVLRSYVTGIRAALAAPKLLAVVWLVLLVAAAPLGVLVQRAIQDDIGGSRVHVELRQRMDMTWLSEFQERHEELGPSVRPATLGRADFLYNLDLLFSGELFAQHPALVAAGSLYALVWLLTLGGVVDRFARGGGRFVLSQFLAACGRYFGRLLRLGALSAVLYWLVYRLARWGYGALEENLQDVTIESTILLYYLLAALPLLVVVGLVMMTFDYARIASVVDEEPNTLKALRRGLSFVLRRPFAVFTLALLVTLSVAALVVLRTVASPGVGESTALGVLAVFLLGQLFLLARLVLRLGFVGSELALYRSLR
ncbi:MAG: hypothetical protein OES32_14655 [Acidobacteriota bacterium]|nr:hypothetical protein [Acidobacteriota bacterium]MDH3524821.1 hypothetical protein [Acidobacteriota bacterium]